MKASDIEPGGVYLGLGRGQREVIRFSPDGNRLLYRNLTEIKQNQTGKVLYPIGSESWVNLDTFAKWACKEVE